MDETPDLDPKADRPAKSASAERQQRYRARCKAGLFVARVELREDVLGSLIRAGLLAETDATDADAVGRALAMVVDARKLEQKALRVTSSRAGAGKMPAN